MKKKFNNSIVKNKLLIFTVVTIFISMLLLNFITPLIMDDYNYSFGLNGRISNLKDIFEYQIWFYFNWGGRNIAHTIAQFFLMNNKIIFNIFNSIVFIILLLLILNFSNFNRTEVKNKFLYLILIYFILWFNTPAYGQSFIWLTGSANYLWTSVIVLLYTLIFINLDENKKYNKLQIFGLSILGLLAGWTNENTGASLIVMLAVYLFIQKIIEKRKLNKIHIFAFTSSIIGFIIMIIAPGNYERSSMFNDNTFFIIKWIKRAIDITQTATSFLIIPISIIIILISIYIYKNQKINKKIYIFLAGIIIATYSMVVSPTFPERSWTIVLIYMTTVIIMLLSELKLEKKLKNIILYNIIIISVIFFLGSYYYTLIDSYGFYKAWDSRSKIMVKEKKNGKRDFEFNTYITSRKQSASFGLGDLYPTKQDSNNKTFARYFGVKSIKAKNS